MHGLRKRLSLATSRVPDGRAWIDVALLTVAFAVVAAPLAHRSGLIEASWRLSPADSGTLALRVLLVPALVEELVFRVLPNPHPSEGSGRFALWASGLGSVVAFVLVHPFVALLGAAPAAFTDPAFLAIVALLGTACLLAYRRSGSLWPPLLLHWLVVMIWLGLGGHGPIAALG